MGFEIKVNSFEPQIPPSVPVILHIASHPLVGILLPAVADEEAATTAALKFLGNNILHVCTVIIDFSSVVRSASGAPSNPDHMLQSAKKLLGALNSEFDFFESDNIQQYVAIINMNDAMSISATAEERSSQWLTSYGPLLQ